jgi:hypothetical protein
MILGSAHASLIFSSPGTLEERAQKHKFPLLWPRKNLCSLGCQQVSFLRHPQWIYLLPHSADQDNPADLLDLGIDPSKLGQFP